MAHIHAKRLLKCQLTKTISICGTGINRSLVTRV